MLSAIVGFFNVWEKREREKRMKRRRKKKILTAIRMHGETGNVIIMTMIELLPVRARVVHDTHCCCRVDHACDSVRVVQDVSKIISLILC